VIRNVLRGLGVLAVAGLVGLVPACGSGSSRSGKLKVAVVTNCTADFWNICEAGAKKAAADFDVEVVFRQPKTNAVADQMEIVEAVQKMGVKGLAVSVINPKEQAPDLSRIAGKVNLITMDNDADGSGRLCYVGVDNFEAGKEAGRLVRHAIPNGGTIALFIGNTTSANSKDRIAGVLTELGGTDVRADVAAGKYAEAYGSYKLAKPPITDDTKEDVALAKAGDALEQLKDTPNVCLVGLYAYNPKALREAARSKKLIDRVKIVGFDEDLITLEGIDKGEIVGSISQDPYNYGYESVKWLAHLARDGDKSKLPQKATPYTVLLADDKSPLADEVRKRGLNVKKASAFAEDIRKALDATKAK
jgi:ribose transport system substrate-binding protein